MRALLSHPMLFNWLIMSIYLANAGQFLLRGMWVDCFYWLSACAITATVTFGYQR
jgi:hypothetical protein